MEHAHTDLLKGDFKEANNHRGNQNNNNIYSISISKLNYPDPYLFNSDDDEYQKSSLLRKSDKNHQFEI